VRLHPGPRLAAHERQSRHRNDARLIILHPMAFSLDDFDFPLPADLIAQQPATERAASRLLALAGHALRDCVFSDLPDMLEPGDLLVFNDTRVIKARLFGEKASGGRIEVLIERPLSEGEALAQVKASKPPRAGTRLLLEGEVEAEVLGRDDDLYRLRFSGTQSVLQILERYGRLPLPPYIGHAPDRVDEARYQTVYSRVPGAVAAPTAGLHFDQPLMHRLAERGAQLAWLTLHVGAGTFQPVRVGDPSRHRMHSEWYSIPRQTREAVLAARSRGARVVAIGTTSLRALESAAAERDAGQFDLAAGDAETRLFILPGYRFRVVDRLVTNFHLPRSTLFMLVCAFGGIEPLRRAYAHAVERRYRFFSYGDAMLIDRMRA
jgi:S-adenosylmethionine:tRNA ribosyltransferase-isomerase